MKVKVTEYNIRNGPLRWQISTSIKVIIEHFSLALIVFVRDIRISKFAILKVNVKVKTYTIRSGVSRWQIPDFLSDGSRNVCIYSYIENESQGQGQGQ